MLTDSWTAELYMQSLDKKCKYETNDKVTIKDYAHMPEVLIDGRVFVDRELFKGYALNLLKQELDDYILFDEKFGLEIAIDVISNIK